MTTLYLCPLSLIPQWFTNLGLTANGGTLQTYSAGTTTPVTTYTDNTGLVANPNPLTLSSAGRPVASSGAPVAFWVPSGTVVKFVAFDASGNQLDLLDNVSALGDPASGGSALTLLASPASSNAAGAGPVAGVDLVANAIKSYDTIADVRAANSPILVSGQTLNIQIQGGLAVNDGLGGDFYWNAASSATDNGTTVIKPATLTGAGRWIRLGTPPFGAVSTQASNSTTDLGQNASNIVSITGSTTITSFGSTANLGAPLYFLQFPGSLTLTYNANSLILPGGANIQTSAQDSAVALYLGSGHWQILAYNRYGAQPPVNYLFFVKPSDQAIVSSTVLTADTALQTVISTGTYLVQLRLQLLGTTTTTQGYKVQLNFGGAITGNTCGSGVCTENGVATAIYPLVNNVITATAISDTASAGDCFNADYMLVVSASGTLVVEFAQNSSSANATTMKAGSTMILTRVA